VRGNHAEIAARPLFQGIEACLEVTDLGAELPVTFLELLVLIALCNNGLLQSIQLAYAILG
jgi:predicted ATP-dependent Lon-type protease